MEVIEMKHILVVFAVLLILVICVSSETNICEHCNEVIYGDSVNITEGSNQYMLCKVCYDNYYLGIFNNINTVPMSGEVTPQYEETTHTLSVDDMEDGVPYIFSNDNIIEIDQISIYLDFIRASDINFIPTLSYDSKIIVRSERDDLGSIELTRIDLSSEEYVDPFTRFFFRFDTGILEFTPPQLSGSYEVDNIDGETNYSKMPLWYYDEKDWQTYYIHSEEKVQEYTVGYWAGTEYEEIILDTPYLLVSEFTERREYNLSRTREGYAVLDLSDLESGYYVMRGFTSKKLVARDLSLGHYGYVIYVE